MRSDPCGTDTKSCRGVFSARSPRWTGGSSYGTNQASDLSSSLSFTGVVECVVTGGVGFRPTQRLGKTHPGPDGGPGVRRVVDRATGVGLVVRVGPVSPRKSKTTPEHQTLRSETIRSRGGQTSGSFCHVQRNGSFIHVLRG